MEKLNEQIKASLFGVAVGDALGVPVEFISREELRQNPVIDMIGDGTHAQEAGTWSDDSSLTFCLAEALTGDFDLYYVGNNFLKWMYQNFWTARGEVFDVGIATENAIEQLEMGLPAEMSGGFEESDNGNGSLMRILPLLFYIADKPIKKRFFITREVSSITHGHIRSVIACFYYLEFARLLLAGKDKFEIYQNLKVEISDFLNLAGINSDEIILFKRLLENNIYEEPEITIQSSGYVLHTLEASIWCLLTTENYRDAVLKAVNLGEDTDTTAAVTGGLAALSYGIENIPKNWIEQIARKEDIDDLAERLGAKLLNIK